MKKVFSLLVTIAFLSPSFAKPKLKEAAKAKSIAKKMIDRNDGRTSYNKTVMLSCRFKRVGTKRKCASKPRKKVIEAINKDIGRNLKDSIGLSLIIHPAADKGVAFLQKDFDREGKDSEQWMYLPAIKKLKRVVSQSVNSPKTGTLFGSEIAYEDIEKIHLSDYWYSYLGEGKEAGRSVYILESWPTKKRARKSSYGRSKLYIDKESYIVLKSESYDRSNRLAKTFFSQRLRKVRGVWVSQLLVVVNHKNGRMSMMKQQKVAINNAIDGGLFKTRALEDSNFRESRMKNVRKGSQ